MELETRILNFFIISKKIFTINQLEKIFNIKSKNDHISLVDALNSLVAKKKLMIKNNRYFLNREKSYLQIELEKFFASKNKFYSLSQLEKIFKINDYNRSAFYKYLYELEMQGQIFCYKNKEYAHVPKDSYIKSGSIMKSNRGKYYIKDDDKVIQIDDLKDAKKLDIVFVELINDEKHPKHNFGKIIRVVKPLNNPTKKNFFVSGEIIRDLKNNCYYLEHDFQRIIINKKSLNGAFPGDKVNALIEHNSNNKNIASVVEIIDRKQKAHIFTFKNGSWIPLGTEKFPVVLENPINTEENTSILAEVSIKKQNKAYTLKVLNKIENKNVNNREKIKLYAKEKNLSFEFSDNVLKEALAIPTTISKEEIKRRLDLRNLETFTIDSSSAKDLDDAISLEKINDTYRLYVHIADVSYYVHPNMFLFEDAIKRGTSIYFADMVIPQLPEVISNGICSLNPNEDRLTKTLIMDINSSGELMNFEFYDSIINSDLKMTYDKVDDLLNNNRVDKDYLPYYNTLLNMQELSEKLEEIRFKRGNISFAAPEYSFKLDNNGMPVSITERVIGPAHKIIENFMLITNSTLADYAYYLDIPYVYRNHECPPIDKVRILDSKIKQISYQYKKIKNLNNPRILQKYYEQICKDKQISEIKYLSNIFLQSMSRAYYDDENKGHYGLALDRYATFTSPIRRGPDLLNHLFLSQILHNDTNSDILEKFRPKLKEISMDLSLKQQEASDFETEIDYLLLQEFVNNFFEKSLKAHVDFLMNDKMYLKTNENITGFIELDSSYIYDENTNSIFDKNHNLYYHVGDVVDVKISSFDNKKHNIIFTLCNIKEKENSKKYSKK